MGSRNNKPGRIVKGTALQPSLKSASGVWSLDEAMQAHRANAWPQPNLFQPVANSLRFKNNSSFVTKQTTRPGNQRTFTVSLWVKRDTLGTRDGIFTNCNVPGTVYWGLEFGADNTLTVYLSGGVTDLITTQVFRDTNAWYHIVVAVDTLQATSSNRTKLYVNGVQVTSFSSAGYPSQGLATKMNGIEVPNISVGSWNPSPGSFHFDGYLAEVNFVDGYQLDPSLFGKFDTNNTWVPVPYTGAYGTNGFYLPFNNATTSQTLGYDASLNGTATYDADQDPYRGHVALHLTGNGPAGGNNNVFADSGPNNLAITRNGDVTQGSFSPFSFNTNAPYNPAIHGASAYFDGTGDYLSTPASTPVNFGSGDFTMECWFYSQTSSKEQVLMGMWASDGAGIGISLHGGGGGANINNVRILSGNGTWTLSTSANNIYSLNSWNHVALVRSGNTWTAYMNGVSATTITYSSAAYYNASIPFTITRAWSGPGAAYDFQGYISNVRVTKGVAVYTANFTPTNKPFGTLTNNLLTFSEDFTYSIWTTSLSVTANAAIAPDSTPSATLFVPSTTSASQNFAGLHDSPAGVNTFSIYAKSAGYRYIQCLHSRSAGGDSGYVTFDLTTGAVTNSSVWSGSIVNAGNGWYRLISTTSSLSGASASSNVRWTFTDGSASRGPSFTGNGTSGAYFWGAQAELASSVGNYTPTPANYSTAPALLLNFANSAVTDTSGSGNIVTVSGATITSSAKYGSGAMTFNGSSDYFQSSWSLNSFLSPGSNNWTLETWVNMTKSLGSAQVIVGYGYESGSTRSFVWYYNGDGTFRLAQSPDGSTNYDAGFGAPQGGFALNTWYHLAIVRNSSAMTMYVNGKAMPNTLSAYTISSISTGYFRIGVEASTYFGGSMDDLRYTKGVARYTSDFAPPARALPEVGGKSFVTTNVNAGVVQRFVTVGTTAWTAPTDVTSVEVLVVAGGGGAGSSGGGGGAGGLIYNNSYPVTPGQTYTVTIGAGGNGGAQNAMAGTASNGSNSIFGNLVATGGGGGGNWGTTGAIGGSGGGAGRDGGSGAAGIAGQGFTGGNTGSGNEPSGGGGGGGAGAVGSAGVTNGTGNGGVGLQFGISGSPTYYAGGGGGAGYNAGTNGAGGSGIGGTGGTNASRTPTTPTANTGSGAGGGGGGGGGANAGGTGATGIVVVRYTTTAVGNSSDATSDNLVDSPTLYGHDMGLGGEVVGNYATMNPLMGSTLPTFSNGNLTITGNSGSSSFGCVYSSIAMTSGNWYAEVRLDVLGTNQTQLGVASYVYPRDSSNQNGLNSGLVLINFDNSLSAYRGVYQNGSVLTGGNVGMTFSAGDIIGVAFNATARTVAFYQNGVSLGSSSPYSVADVGTGQFYFVGIVGNIATTKLSWNFGQRAWAYTPPAGYNALTTKNLPRLAIGSAAATPNQYFDVATWTQGATDVALTNAGGFQPDFVWIKSRSNSQNHYLMDSVRGTTGLLRSNGTGAESTGSTWITFNSNGFTPSSANTVTNTYTYVGWQWKAGGTAVSNTSGTLTSQVSANTTSGFSVVTYTGTGVNATVGHGLGVAPSMYICKRRNSTSPWRVYHTSLSYTTYINLSDSGAAASDSSVWNSAPTTSVFGIGTNDMNTNTGTYVAYCWAEISGFSKFGSYVGNGSADGPFVYTGFQPAFILTKDITTGSYWWEIVDSARAPFNPSDKTLYANVADSEYSGSGYNKDLLSNGFKIRGTSGGHNTSGSTYIYMAFAGKPFGNVNGTAR